MAVRIELLSFQFRKPRTPACRNGEFTVSAFRYASGIEALRVSNARGEIIVLPFKGQQIWRARFDGRDLTMKSMFDEPVDTQVYLETYGAFMIHCGLTGLGAPGPEDSHPLHGEIPNAPFQKAWLEIDEASQRITIGGSYRHTVAFSTNYLATAKVAMDGGLGAAGRVARGGEPEAHADGDDVSRPCQFQACRSWRASLYGVL